MAVKQLTSTLARELAVKAVNGEIQEINLARRESGKQKGKLFVDYKLREETEAKPEHFFAHDAFVRLALALESNTDIVNAVITKTADEEEFSISVTVA